MAKITISTSEQAGDIPTYNFTVFEIENSCFIEKQLELSDDKVFVSFQSWEKETDNISEDYERRTPTILVSNSIEDTMLWFEDFIENIKFVDINYSFFCFENYEEAFKYCIELKEGL